MRHYEGVSEQKANGPVKDKLAAKKQPGQLALPRTDTDMRTGTHTARMQLTCRRGGKRNGTALQQR